MSNMLCKSWRALETTKRGDIITQELFTFYRHAINLTPSLVIQCDTVPLKIWHPPPNHTPRCAFAYPLLLKYLFLWLLSVSLAGVSFSSRPLKVGGAPGLEFTCFSWDIHSSWRCHWGLILWKPSHANDGKVYVPALTAPQNPYT